MTDQPVRTRFAPSPTGYLHIGGVRTALFCWLFARRHGGQFILRIDDTDVARNIESALAPILHGFRWLGIDWDEGPEVGGPHAPYYQSQRGDRYRAAVAELVNRGAAYWDFARPEEIQAEREAAQREGRHFLYSRRFAAGGPRERAKFEAEGRQGVVRLKMPREGSFVLNDLVRGRVEFAWASEQDHVVQRSDGTFLYHLASVVDDHDFRISHVIRAEEHLPNTPRQAFIAQSLGVTLPQYAHLPYVAEPGSRNKLSKRKLAKYLRNRDFAQLNERGAAVARAIGLSTAADTFNPVIVDFYEQIGFLPEALVNYLLLLGWSLDDRTELMSREEMIRSFALERVNKAPASFDPVKLMAFQEHYMRRLPAPQKREMAVHFLQRAGYVGPSPSAEVVARIERVLDAAGDRIRIGGDILDFADFFVSDDALPLDERAVAKRLRGPAEAVGLLSRFRERLASVETFDAAALEGEMRSFVEAEGIKIAQVIHALRVAVTGKEVGFGLFETLCILGRESCLRRIDRAIEAAKRPAVPG